MKQETDANIFKTFRDTCNASGSATAIYYKKNTYQSYTFEQYARKVDFLAQFLKNNHGIEKGTSVAIILDNTPYWPLSYLALMANGAIAVPLYHLLKAPELTHLLHHSQAKLLITSSNLLTTLKGALKDQTVPVLTIDSLEELAPGYEPRTTPFQPPEISPDDIASIVYTSGTTSLPKGVMLSHRNFLSNIESFKKLKLVDSSDCFICMLPLYHTYPFTVTMLLPLLTGAKISFPANINFEEISVCMQQTNVTILLGVPRLFTSFYETITYTLSHLPPLKRLLLSLALACHKPCQRLFGINLASKALVDLHKKFGSKLRLMISGSAALEPKVSRAFSFWGFTLLEGYGLTEAAPVVSFNMPGATKTASAGKPLPDVQVKIENGEVQVKGNNVMRGYFKDDAGTSQRIKNGWLHTQDTGFLDADGFLFVTGRTNETIILSSGKKINPEELEAHYKQCPFIEELCIFKPRFSGSGDQLTAIIVPDLKYFLAHGGSGQVKDKIRWHIENLSLALAPYQRIQKYLVITENLPRTVLGKVKRYEVERNYLKYAKYSEAKENTKELSPEDAALLALPLSQKIIAHFSKMLKKDIHIGDHLELDLGLDSLERVGMFLELQKITGRKLDEQRFFFISTMRDVLIELEQEFQTPASEVSVPTNWNEIVHQPVDESIQNSVILNQSHIAHFANILLAIILRTITRSLFLLTSHGTENLPKQGPFILCPNHTSFLDGPIVAAALPNRTVFQTYFLGYTLYIDSWPIKWLKKLLRFISIEPTSTLETSLGLCGYVLKNNKILCLFPEGDRSPDGSIKDFKPGIGILAQELNIPVVPVYIDGAYAAWPPAKILPRPRRIRVFFGKPLFPQELRAASRENLDIYQTIAHTLKNELIKLSASGKVMP